jgi:uncharacterized protein
VFDYLDAGNGAASVDANGVSLLQWCAYYGDVSAMRLLLSRGARLDSLGENFDLGGAAFHGHWQLCQFLLEQGAQPNVASPSTGETALHSALCHSSSRGQDQVVRVLLSRGADPNLATKPGVETGCFMRDCRTKGETALHRAAAFAEPGTIQRLLDAGAALDRRDANGETPLSWASWSQRPTAVLVKLCYGAFRVRTDRVSMEETLVGRPH